MNRIKTRFALFLVFSLLLVPVFSFAVSAENTGRELILFEDDFESYQVGDFPSSGGWEMIFSGAGRQYQVIVDGVSASPTKSLQLIGQSNWACDTVKRFSTDFPIIGYEVKAMVEDIDVIDKATGRVGFWSRAAPNIGRFYALVQFNGGGTLRVGGQVLQNYVPNTWYNIKVILNRETKLYSVWIDDVPMVEDVVFTQDPYAIEAFGLASEMYGSYEAYFDDVKIFAIDDSSYPTANFVWSPNKPNSGENAHFDASSSQPGWNDTQIVPIASYTWDFGDNTIATGESVDHTYALPGVYTVKLTVSNVLGQNRTSQKQITVGTSVVSLFASSSASLIGFQVNLEGILTFDGTPVAAEPIQMFYSTNGGNSWNEITSSDTNTDGQYSAIWLPSATGNYIIRAKWEGNQTFPEAEAVTSLAVIPSPQQSIFSVTSNSTITSLAYNSTTSELSFTVSGPSNTAGYTNVFISKTLLSDPTALEVSLDGKQLEYTVISMDDSWEIQFTYSHSTHTVVVAIPEADAISSPSTEPVSPSPETSSPSPETSSPPSESNSSSLSPELRNPSAEPSGEFNSSELIIALSVVAIITIVIVSAIMLKRRH